MSQDRPSLSEFTSAHWLLLCMACAFYAMLMVYRIDMSHLDVGDGNYLYISQRMADGLTLYKDIVCPQPPLHLTVGSLLMMLGDDAETRITIVRTYSIALHLLSMFLVVAIAYVIWGVARTATLAGLIFLILPLGLWWGQGFQSESLAQVLMLGTFLALLIGGVHGLVVAAVLSVLGCFTNMTFLPYLGLHMLYVVGRHRKDGLWTWYVIPFVVLFAMLFAIYNTLSGGHYIENVWSNQVGSFPAENTFQYVVGKLTGNGQEVMRQEGAFVLLALLGMLAQWRRHSMQMGVSTHYVVWYGLASLGSLVFVAKGGTVQYIFTLGEPMVAIFAAYYLYHLHEQYLVVPLRELGPVAGGSRVLMVITLTIMLGLPTYMITVRMASDELPTRVYERSHEEVVDIVNEIRRNSERYGVILAPSFYAFASERRLAGECPETYLVGIRYLNEYRRLCQVLGREPELALPPRTTLGVKQMQTMAVHQGLETEAQQDLGIVDVVDRIVNRLERREASYVLLNVEPRQAFAYIVEIWTALDQHYQIVDGEINYGREEQLLAFRPKRATPLPRTGQ